MTDEPHFERCTNCLRLQFACSCTPEYIGFITDCDCCGVTIEEAAAYCGPAFTYTLHVHRTQELWAIGMIRRFVAHLTDHPCAPCINIVTHNTQNRYEWWLSANGKAKGSRSVS